MFALGGGGILFALGGGGGGNVCTRRWGILFALGCVGYCLH